MSELPPPKHSLEELGRLGEEIKARVVMPAAKPEDDGLYVAIDVDTERFEIDRKLNDAINRLRVARPEAELWLSRIGRDSLSKFTRRT